MSHKNKLIAFVPHLFIGAITGAIVSGLPSHFQQVHVVSILLGAFISGIGGILIVYVLSRRSPKTTTTETQQSLSNPADGAPLSTGDPAQAPQLPSAQDFITAAAAAAQLREHELQLAQAKQFYLALPDFRKLVIAEIDRQSQTLLDQRAVRVKAPVEISQRTDLLDLEVVDWLKGSNWSCKRTWHKGWWSEPFTRHCKVTYHPDWWELEITPMPEV